MILQSSLGINGGLKACFFSCCTPHRTEDPILHIRCLVKCLAVGCGLVNICTTNPRDTSSIEKYLRTVNTNCNICLRF